MGKKGATAASDDAADTVQSLPTTNGSQLALFPWLRELDGNLECFDSDEAYYLTNGSWVNNAGKAVYFSVEHAVLARAGFLAKEKFGISLNHFQRMTLLHFIQTNSLQSPLGKPSQTRALAAHFLLHHPSSPTSPTIS